MHVNVRSHLNVVEINSGWFSPARQSWNTANTKDATGLDTETAAVGIVGTLHCQLFRGVSEWRNMSVCWVTDREEANKLTTHLIVPCVFLKSFIVHIPAPDISNLLLNTLLAFTLFFFLERGASGRSCATTSPIFFHELSFMTNSPKLSLVFRHSD